MEANNQGEAKSSVMLKDDIIRMGILQSGGKGGHGVHRMEQKGECQGEYTREGAMSKGRIPKDCDIERGYTKIKRYNPRGSQGEHGGCKGGTKRLLKGGGT